MIIKYLVRCCQRRTIKYDRKLKSFLSDEMIQRLQAFEENCFYKYSYDLDLITKERLEEKLTNAASNIENINSRIDDIFFKENITKSSLYKVELRLQKLEDLAFETMHQLNSLNKFFGNSSSSNININNKNKSINDWRNIIKQKVLRHRSVTLSGAECLNFKLNESSVPTPAPSIVIDNSTYNEELHHQLSDADSFNEKLQSSLLSNTNNNNNNNNDSLSDDVLSQQAFVQQQTNLDQYTIHPFVYLHSVVKPPLAEYTSITDCIDTSTIDRPPSPQMQSSHTTHNISSNLLNFVPKVSKLTNIKDYCAVETTRSAVARQESEILRLAEESQHVIINQMLNKLVKQASIDEIETDNNDEDGNISNELNVNSNSISNIDSCSKDQIIKTENETSFIFNNNNHRQKSNKTKLNKELADACTNVPLSQMERNYSQMFYAQTQAGTLVSHEEEDVENDDDEIKIKTKF
jgi:hypothetical protein